MEPKLSLDQRGATLIQWLKENPDLFDQVEKLLSEINDQIGSVRTLDETEDAVIVRLRSLGREALQTWLQKTAAQTPADGGTPCKKSPDTDDAGDD